MPVKVNEVTLGNTFSAGSYEVPSMVVFVRTRAVLSAKGLPFCEDYQLVMDYFQPLLFILADLETLMPTSRCTPSVIGNLLRQQSAYKILDGKNETKQTLNYFIATLCPVRNVIIFSHWSIFFFVVYCMLSIFFKSFLKATIEPIPI